MKKALIILFTLISFSTTAYADISDWKCYLTHSAGRSDTGVYVYSEGGSISIDVDASVQDYDEDPGYDSDCRWGWGSLEYYFVYEGEGDPTPITVYVSIGASSDVVATGWASSAPSPGACSADASVGFTGGGFTSGYSDAAGNCDYGQTGVVEDASSDADPEDDYDIESPTEVEADGSFVAATGVCGGSEDSFNVYGSSFSVSAGLSADANAYRLSDDGDMISAQASASCSIDVSISISEL
jgi:hypothetical protein